MFEQVPKNENGDAINPYAGRAPDGSWQEGVVSVDLLEQKFGHLSTAAEMKAATTSEGLRLYFEWLAEQNIIPTE